MKKVIVTGGAGFIGHVVEYFLNEGFSVFVLDNLSTGRIENLNEFRSSENLLNVTYQKVVPGKKNLKMFKLLSI